MAVYISLFFALGFDVSLAIGNTGLGLAIALGIACAIKKRDSLQPLQRIDSGLIKVIAIFFIITVLSWLAGGEFSSKGISNITNQVVFRFAPFLLLPMAIKNKQQLIGFTAVLLVSFFINNSYLIWQGMEAAEALGGGSFMLIWGYFLWFSLKGWHKSGHYAYACFFAVVCSFTLQGLTEYNLGSALTSKFLWLTMAMSLRWLDLDGL